MYYLPCLLERERYTAEIRELLSTLNEQGIIVCVDGLRFSNIDIVVNHDSAVQFHMASKWLWCCRKLEARGLKTLFKRQKHNTKCSSYRFKRQVEDSCGIQVSHGIMILAMVSCGFVSVEELRNRMTEGYTDIYGWICNKALKSKIDWSPGYLKEAMINGWSPRTHCCYGEKFRQLVETLFKIRIAGGSFLSLLPNELVFPIISLIS